VTDRPKTETSAAAGIDRWAMLWHAGWAAVLVLAAIATPVASDATPLGLAMVCAAAPGIAGLWRRSPPGRFDGALLALWAVGVGAAIVMTGGLIGPFAIWALAPLPAAIVMGGGRKLAAAAALTAGVAAVAALAQAAGLAPPVESHPWLTLLALATLGLALSAALLVMQRRAGSAEARERRRLVEVLGEQSLLILLLDNKGAVLSRFGPLPEGLTREALNAGLPAIAADPAPVNTALETAQSAGRAEIAFAPAFGADRWLVAQLARHRDGLTAVLRDATLERSREAALEQAAVDAEALNAGKSRFLANMSHELRTPLNAIIGFSDIMRSAMFGPLAGKYAEYAGLIHESGGHLLDLINDVLDMSKIEAQRFELTREEFDARDAVAASLRLTRVQADSARVHLRGVLPPQPLEVDADRRAIKQIVLNLVANALKFTPAGGQITVTAQAQGADLELIVADTGVGISAADLDRLGRPYEQAGTSDDKVRGTGLGLSLVRAFAELHGGTMSIESALGEGTAVTVRLPVMLAPLNGSPPAPLPLGGNVVAFSAQR
jgi:cell cycle sensor histidine kinase DivJ